MISETASHPGDDDQPWTKIIVPERGVFEVPWNELWRYRDLIWLLARRSIMTTYKQTVLGPFWFIVQPLMVTTVFSYLFGRMAQFGSDKVPHYLFYMGGLVLWNFFSETVLRTARSFTDYQQLFAKVYFPRLTVPLAVVLANSVPFAVQFALFAVGLIVYLVKQAPWIEPTWWILATPVILLQTALLALGVGCCIAALTKRFRDLAIGVQIGLQLWMFGSAIVFPLSRIAPSERWLFFLNPMVPIIECFRYAFLGVSLVQPWHIALSWITTVGIFLIGILLYNRAEQNSMDTI